MQKSLSIYSEHDQHAKQCVPQYSHVNIQTRQKAGIGDSMKTVTSSCLKCYTRYKATKSIESFDDFGDISWCIHKIVFYNYLSKLAIGLLS